MATTEKDKVVWAELQRQLDALGLCVKRGKMQDATITEADPDRPTNREVFMLKPVAVEMDLG